MDLSQGLNGVTLIETAWQQNVFAEINWKSWLNAADIQLTDPNIVRFEEEQNVLQAAIAGQGAALIHANWKTWGDEGAAALLGVKPSTLAYQMKTFGIKKPSIEEINN